MLIPVVRGPREVASSVSKAAQCLAGNLGYPDFMARRFPERARIIAVCCINFILAMPFSQDLSDRHLSCDASVVIPHLLFQAFHSISPIFEITLDERSSET